MVKITLSAKWNNLIHIVEDTAILGRKMMMIVIMMMMMIVMMMMMEKFFDEKDFYSEFLSHLSFVFFLLPLHPLLFTITDASLDVVTSRKVRDKIKLGHSIEQLVGEKINEYVNIHRIGAKVG